MSAHFKVLISQLSALSLLISFLLLPSTLFAQSETFDQIDQGNVPSVETCKGERKSWGEIEQELRNLGYAGPFTHNQQLLTVYNGTACPTNREGDPLRPAGELSTSSD